MGLLTIYCCTLLFLFLLQSSVANIASYSSNTSKADNSTSLTPDKNFSSPEINTSVSDNNSSSPDNNTSVCNNNSSRLDNSTSISDKNTSKSDNVPINSNVCKKRSTSLKINTYIVVLVCIFVVGILGNVLAVVTVLSSKRLRKQPTNRLITSLCLCDLGALLFLTPIRLDTYSHGKNFCFDVTVCKMFNIFDFIFHVNSITHLFIITVDRYVAVSAPFRHQRTMARPSTLIFCIAFSWVYSGVWASLSVFDWADATKITMYIRSESNIGRYCILNNPLFLTVCFIVVYIVPLSIMGGLYIGVLKIALKQARMIASLSVFYSQQEQRTSKKKRREANASKTVAVVYGAFCVCWLPLAILTLASTWCNRCFQILREKNPTAFEVFLTMFIEILPTFSSCLNPYLYILLNKHYRQASRNIADQIIKSARNCTRLNKSNESDTTNVSKSKRVDEHRCDPTVKYTTEAGEAEIDKMRKEQQLQRTS